MAFQQSPNQVLTVMFADPLSYLLKIVTMFTKFKMLKRTRHLLIPRWGHLQIYILDTLKQINVLQIAIVVFCLSTVNILKTSLQRGCGM